MNTLKQLQARENVKSVIVDLAKENYRNYMQIDEHYIDFTAREYWEYRLDEEIERDEAAGVTLHDYKRWVKDGFEEALAMQS